MSVVVVVVCCLLSELISPFQLSVRNEICGKQTEYVDHVTKQHLISFVENQALNIFFSSLV